jgi:hypothetical protein
MVKYQISLSSGRAYGDVIMNNIECSDWDAANAFAEALAGLMPEATYYCQKNSCDINRDWTGFAEVQTDE